MKKMVSVKLMREADSDRFVMAALQVPDIRQSGRLGNAAVEITRDLLSHEYRTKMSATIAAKGILAQYGLPEDQIEFAYGQLESTGRF